MKWSAANSVVEELRRDTRLYLPGLSKRRGFSSSRVEHLLNRLVQAMPQDECYLEVGTLEGRTLEAASVGNDGKTLIGVDPCEKYDTEPNGFGENVLFVRSTWQDLFARPSAPDSMPLGLVFYDGDHSVNQTWQFMLKTEPLADEAVLVLDDWDRESVRTGAFAAAQQCINAGHENWRLLRELPSYGDGLTCPQDHFGWSFGISVWGFKR